MNREEAYYRNLAGQAAMQYPGFQTLGAIQQVGAIQNYNAYQRSYNKAMSRKMDDIMCLGDGQYLYKPSKIESRVKEQKFELKEQVFKIEEVVREI